jgi:phthiocerol/phenolphthiocerol synthesis type-I polyketide synthase E
VRGRAREGRRVVFLFPGQGSQHVGMGRGLYEGEEVYRRWLERCLSELGGALEADLRGVLLGSEGREEEAESALRQTRLAQPAQFAVSYALARTWLEWGVEPAGMVGHSVGEYVAASLSGVLEVGDAMRLVGERGRLMQEMEGGGMLSVGLGEEELERRLSGRLEVAAVNGPVQSVVTGPEEEVERLREELEREGVRSRRLRTSHAFHSGQMEPAVGRYVEAVRGVRLGRPKSRYASNVSGELAGEEVMEAEYWGRQLRERVRFWAGLERVREGMEDALLLEVGPGNALTSLVKQQGEVEAVASMRHPEDRRGDRRVLLEALGRLWVSGAEVDWEAYGAGRGGRRVHLPTYPFQRRRYWIDGHVTVTAGTLDSGADAEANETEREPQEPQATLPPVEQSIADRWRALIGVDTVRPTDNFFELGGNSLLATHLVNQLIEAYDIELTVRHVFDNPTTRDLARVVEALHATDDH